MQNLQQTSKGVGNMLNSSKDFNIKDVGESTSRGAPNCCHIILFFKGPMFELQPCHYYERFSQCFCIL